MTFPNSEGKRVPQVKFRTRRDGQWKDVTTVWTEKNGPRLTIPRGQAGFGSKLVHTSLSSQLGGAITFQWAQL